MPADWTDRRPIETLRFGSEWKPTVGDLQAAVPGFGVAGAEFPLRPGDPPTDEVLAAWKEAHADRLNSVRVILQRCECTIAEDIVALGCTGVAHKLLADAAAHGAAFSGAALTDTIQGFRLGLGGTGVGLPCYVPPDRYCLVHEVSGGLQDGQEQKFPEKVNTISRELTPAERAQVELTDHARRSSAESENSQGAAHAVLAGRQLPEGWEREGQTLAAPFGEAMRALVDRTPEEMVAASQAWKCPEHTEPRWDCCFCVAQMVAEGPLEPRFLATFHADAPKFLYAHEVGAALADDDLKTVVLYAQAASFQRKLTRTE